MKRREVKRTQNPVESIGAGRLRRLRRKLDLSQEEMATMLGVSYVTINRWENGRYSPSKLAQEKIAKVLMKMEGAGG